MGKSKLNEGNAIRPENAAQIYKVLDELESARERWSQQRCAEKELAYYNECMELLVELIIVLGSTPPASDAERANRDLLAEAFDGIRIASKVFLWRYYGQGFTILRGVEEMDASAGDYSERLSVTSVELENVNHRLERLYDALETGSLKLADLAPRIQRLRQRQEQLNAVRLELENLLSDRKVELADMETVKSYVEDLRNLLEDSPLIERKSFIKSFVKEIRIAGNEVVLKYNIPPSVGAPNQETLVVPPIVHYGGR